MSTGEGILYIFHSDLAINEPDLVIEILNPLVKNWRKSEENRDRKRTGRSKGRELEESKRLKPCIFDCLCYITISECLYESLNNFLSFIFFGNF